MDTIANPGNGQNDNLMENSKIYTNINSFQCDGNIEKCAYQRNNIQCQLWTDQEISLLNQAVEKYGTNWQLIHELFFKDRKPNCIKCKYNYMKSKKMKPQSLKLLPNISNNIHEYKNFLQRQTDLLIRQTKGNTLYKQPEPIYGIQSHANINTEKNMIYNKSIHDPVSIKLDSWLGSDMQFDYFDDYSMLT